MRELEVDAATELTPTAKPAPDEVGTAPPKFASLEASCQHATLDRRFQVDAKWPGAAQGQNAPQAEDQRVSMSTVYPRKSDTPWHGPW